VDTGLTPETRAVFRNLHGMQGKGIMIGHQDALAYGVGWKYEEGRSDIHDVTGDHPAVYGWELGRIELGWPNNLDSVPFDRMRSFIRKGYEAGGVITISWHLNNPLTGKTAWDPAEGTVASILPGGSKHDVYNRWLDSLAGFLGSLKGSRGEAIPVVLRLFHELNGDWFWWGRKHCSPEELKALWRHTVSYLRDKKGLHNLIYAFNTDRFATVEDYLERYPGDEWVDLVGFDIYQRKEGNEKFRSDLDGMLTRLESIAEAHHKIPALTEFGYGGLPDPDWWTGTFWKVLKGHHVVWALAWRNGDAGSCFMPYRGQASAADFVKMYDDAKSWFGKDVIDRKYYR